MPRLTIWFSDELAARLEALPAARDNRSAFLRRLIIQAVGGAQSVRGEPPVRGRPTIVRVGLNAKDAARLDKEAAAFGFGRAIWLASLVGRRFRNAPRFSRADETALVGIQMELRRIALGLARLAGNAAEKAGQEGRPAMDAQALAAMAAEIRGHMASIRAAFEGNLAYWKIEHE
jgi:hypothetical protein